jgi:hypothetical protein
MNDVSPIPPEHPARKGGTAVVMLRWPLGGPTDCPDCYGRGYYPSADDDPRDVYCSCAAGQMRSAEE